jgi:hypothetical protein
VGIHLAAEHSLQLEVAHLAFERGRFALDVARGGFVVLAFGELEQLVRIRDGFGGVVELGELGAQACTLAAEFLGLVGLVPDAGIFELATDFFQPLFLAVVLKETPSASWCARLGL